MAFSGFRNPLKGPFKGSLQKLGSALSTSVVGGINQALGHPIAIDFGTSSMKIIQFAHGEPPHLIAAACLETPEDLLRKPEERLAFQLDALPRLIRDGGFKGKRAVCAIPAWTTFCKQLQVGRAEGPALSAAVQAAVPIQLGCDPSAIVYRYIEIGGSEKSGKSDVLLIGVGRDLVERLMKVIVSCKLEPVGMHSEFASVLHAFDHVHQRAEDASSNTLYMDLGSTTTKVMISHGRTLAFARVIDVGGYHLDSLLAEQTGCSLQEARNRRISLSRHGATANAVRPAAVLAGADAAAHAERRDGALPAGFTAELLSENAERLAPEGVDLSEPIETLTDEVQLCLRYHASQYPGRRVDKIVFVGGEARHRGLCQQIARRLRLPAHVADPMARAVRTGSEPCVGVDFHQPQPGWAMVMGLCLSPTDL